MFDVHICAIMVAHNPSVWHTVNFMSISKSKTPLPFTCLCSESHFGIPENEMIFLYNGQLEIFTETRFVQFAFKIPI